MSEEERSPARRVEGASPRAPLWLALGVLGLASRFLLSAFSYGTNDVDTWRRFARLIHLDGLAALYHRDPLFNHPPLAGLLAESLLSLSEFTGVSFPFLLRLPGVLAECATAYLVWWGVARTRGQFHADRAVAVFGLSLISILVSGYHGNTDPIYVALMVAALLLLERAHAPILSGFAIGAALNVKLLPALLVPVLLSRCRTRREAFRLLLGMVPWAIPFLVMFRAVGSDFAENVFAYGSQGDYWGIPGFLTMAHGNTREVESLYRTLAEAYRFWGRPLVVASALGLCWWYRRPGGDRIRAVELAAVVYGAFAVLAPGFAVQYLVIFPPLLALIAPRWAVRISLLAGVMALTSYLSFLVSWDPIRSSHNATANKPVAFLAGMLWIALFAFVCEMLARFKRVSPERRDPPRLACE